MSRYKSSSASRCPASQSEIKFEREQGTQGTQIKSTMLRFAIFALAIASAAAYIPVAEVNAYSTLFPVRLLTIESLSRNLRSSAPATSRPPAPATRRATTRTAPTSWWPTRPTATSSTAASTPARGTSSRTAWPAPSTPASSRACRGASGSPPWRRAEGAPGCASKAERGCTSPCFISNMKPTA